MNQFGDARFRGLKSSIHSVKDSTAGFATFGVWVLAFETVLSPFPFDVTYCTSSIRRFLNETGK